MGLASLLYLKFIVTKKSARELERVLRFRNGPFHDVVQVKPDGLCAADVSHSQSLGMWRKQKKKNLVVATWNVHMLLDQSSSKSK